ncbi:hypothetical protein SAMN04487925_101136 [Bradyrhizobium sp. cf659]|nr:hypothetical protein SAMN04487925_101136 [Bradyrhizobium sp. cf659]
MRAASGTHLHRALGRRSDDRSRWMIRRWAGKAVGNGIIERPEQLQRTRIESCRHDRRPSLQHLQHADREERAILALLAVLLIGTARHVGRHVLRVGHLHVAGHRMSCRRWRHQRRNHQPRGHEDREHEPEDATSNHGATLSQGDNAGKPSGSQVCEQGTPVVNRLKRPQSTMLLRNPNGTWALPDNAIRMRRRSAQARVGIRDHRRTRKSGRVAG